MVKLKESVFSMNPIAQNLKQMEETNQKPKKHETLV